MYDSFVSVKNNITVLATFSFLDTIPDTQNLKEERFVFVHDSSSWLAGFKAKTKQ